MSWRLARPGRKAVSPPPPATAAAARPPPIRAACRAMRPGGSRSLSPRLQGLRWVSLALSPSHNPRLNSATELPMIRILAASFAFTAVLASNAMSDATAADYPSRPVNLIVAFAPGGPSDVLARIVGHQLEKILGQPFIIDNRPGGSGNIAADTAARAAPDGYTLLMGNNGLLATNQSLFKKLNFDGGKDFAPLHPIRSPPHNLVGQSEVSAMNMAGASAYAEGHS